jgi:predicted nucleotide-binding protein (sugar kinase/HSP70/actin superfamily)
VDLVEAEGGEAVMPDLLDFFLYSSDGAYVRRKLLEGTLSSYIYNGIAIKFMESFRQPIRKALKGSKFGMPSDIKSLAKTASKIISVGNISGEGWFLTGEMLELIHGGAPNIICMQPFACLPNHVTGKGVMKILKKHYPQANIVAVDYDPGASEVNQINRIKLMMAMAKRNLTQKK